MKTWNLLLSDQTTYVLMVVVGIPVVLFRLFGVLFFFESSSLWLLTPAAVIAALLLFALNPPQVPTWMVGVIVALYALSYFNGGWSRLSSRIADERGLMPDLPELILVIVLLLRWWCMRLPGRKA
ncbi:MAG: hypothetical protein WA210_10675 [Burkholderiaceae bacterium]